jgi:hypothetical protein
MARRICWRLGGLTLRGIEEATSHMVQAQDNLDALRDELDQLQIAQVQQEFKQQAAEWKVKAKSNLVDFQNGLKQEAGQSLLGSPW